MGSCKVLSYSWAACVHAELSILCFFLFFRQSKVELGVLSKELLC